MDTLQLRRPVPGDEAAAADLLKEFAAAGETRVPGGAGIEKRPYGEWLAHIDQFSRDEGLPEGYVPSDTYFAVRVSDGRIVGVIDVRHRLTERLWHIAGHIGYAIRPSERRKGYGSEQLRLALARCAELGIDRALVTCDEDNPASANTALSQGGVEIESFTDEDDMVQRRFLLPTGR